MTKTILLTKKEGNTSDDIQQKVESINIFQFLKTLNIVRDIIKIAQDDESIREVIDSLMTAGDIKATEGMTEEQIEEASDAAFMGAALKGFEAVLANLPEKAFELISVTSGIDQKLLGQQKIMTLFAVYDAIIEVNDVREIVERAKKSLDVTSQKMNFKKFAKTKALKDAAQ